MKVGDPGVEPSWDICGSILDSAINRYFLQTINLALCGHVVRYEVVESSQIWQVLQPQSTRKLNPGASSSPRSRDR